MNQRDLTYHAYARYINFFLVILFLSDIPMPVDKRVLLWCSSAALLGNFFLHVYTIHNKALSFRGLSLINA